MALAECKECGKEISDQADFCPHCGFPLRAKQPIDRGKDLIKFRVRGGEDSFVAQEIVALTYWAYKAWVKILTTLAYIGVFGGICTAGFVMETDLGEFLVYIALLGSIYFISVPIAVYINHGWVISTGSKKRYRSFGAIRDAIKKYRDFAEATDYILLDQGTSVRVYSHLVAPKRIASFEKRHWYGLAFFLCLFVGLAAIIIAAGCIASEEAANVGTVLLIVGVLLFTIAFIMIGWCVRIRGIGGLSLRLVMSKKQANWFFGELESKLKEGRKRE